MALQLRCPSCGKALRVGDGLVGRTAPCPNCKSPITVPIPTAQLPSAEPMPGQTKQHSKQSRAVSSPSATTTANVANFGWGNIHCVARTISKLFTVVERCTESRSADSADF